MKPQYHRELNSLLIVILFVSIALNTYMIAGNKHTLEQCETRLFEKLTNQKAPKEIR